jgi:DNA-binding NarL/FixJ family response regulator
MRFLLVEDHPLMRIGIMQLLGRSFPEAVIDEAETASAAMGKVASAPWDLILLDLELPDRSGVDLLSDIRALAPKSKVLVLSGMSEAELGARLLKAGAWGYVAKATAGVEVVQAIKRVLSGRRHVSPELAAAIVEEALDPGEGPVHERLSDREFEVLRMYGKGLTASEIADRLGISIKTASTYRSRILEKLHLRTTGDIVRYAVSKKVVALIFFAGFVGIF